MKKSALLFASAGLALGLSANTQAAQIYTTDFETGVGSEWSGSTPSSSNGTFTNFLGRLGNNTTTLTLNGLGAGTHEITLDFDLYLIDSWDGDSWRWGTDRFNIGGDYSQSWILPTEEDELNFISSSRGHYGFSGWTDEIYRGASVTFMHTGDSLNLDFFGSGLQGINDESWGLDNVAVSSTEVPEPSSLALFAFGLLGLGYMRKKTKS